MTDPQFWFFTVLIVTCYLCTLVVVATCVRRIIDKLDHK